MVSTKFFSIERVSATELMLRVVSFKRYHTILLKFKSFLMSYSVAAPLLRITGITLRTDNYLDAYMFALFLNRIVKTVQIIFPDNFTLELVVNFSMSLPKSSQCHYLSPRCTK